MTMSPEGEPERKDRGRRAAEARQRADQARERAQEARDRLVELRQNQSRLMEDDGTPIGSRADRAERAEALAEESRRQAHRAAENAAAASRASSSNRSTFPAILELWLPFCRFTPGLLQPQLQDRRGLVVMPWIGARGAYALQRRRRPR
jgi:hypothetical protein